MGCSRGVDHRLVLADTLMWTRPDSSLAILEAINRDSLQGEENQAYYALLLTQAQFRCNIPLTSDTLISKAVDYYSDNHNREHYTRSLLYKGGAFEDMNRPVDAMRYYKQAEENADTTDYRNLAQLNMRMGMLYYNNYASNNLDLEKFEKALYYYEMVNDKYNVMRSLLMSGNVLRISNSKKANKYYDKAQTLATELKDTFNLYSIYVNKSILFLNDTSYQESKDNMIKAFALSPQFIENYHYSLLSQAYARLGLVDSAVFYLYKDDIRAFTPYDSLMRYKALKDISIAKGDYSKANQYDRIYYHLSDSLEHNNNKYSLTKFENEFNSDKLADKSKSVFTLNQIIFYLIALFTITLIALIIYHKRKKKDYLKLISDLRNENFSRYAELMNSLAEFDDDFSQTISLKLKAFEQIMSGAYNEQLDYLSTETAHKITPIPDSDKKFWNGLLSYLNYKYDGVMDRIIKEYPMLTKADINFIGLMCCGFSDAAIAVCKNYRNTHTVRGGRQKIKDKMGIEKSLLDFVKTRIN
ncbi:MAG: hypothetical protein IJG81_11060 [Muribaculaceae bacterium]|nr:hypothetical protein [Muribaculaceae bacterium]